MSEKQNARKRAQKEAIETKKRASEEYIVAAGEAYNSTTKRKKPSPFSSVENPEDDGTPSAQVQTQLLYRTIVDNNQIE